MKKAITITNSKIIINKKVFERMCLLVWLIFIICGLLTVE